MTFAGEERAGVPSLRGDPAGVPSFRGRPLGRGEVVADFAGVGDFLGVADFFAAAVFFGAGVAFFGEAAFFGAGEALFFTGSLSANAFLAASVSFLIVEVFLAGLVFFVTLALASAAAFFADCTFVRGERRTAGSGVAEALALPPFLGVAVFAFAMIF